MKMLALPVVVFIALLTPCHGQDQPSLEWEMVREAPPPRGFASVTDDTQGSPVFCRDKIECTIKHSSCMSRTFPERAYYGDDVATQGKEAIEIIKVVGAWEDALWLIRVPRGDIQISVTEFLSHSTQSQRKTIDSRNLFLLKSDALENGKKHVFEIALWTYQSKLYTSVCTSDSVVEDEDYSLINQFILFMIRTKAV